MCFSTSVCEFHSPFIFPSWQLSVQVPSLVIFLFQYCYKKRTFLVQRANLLDKNTGLTHRNLGTKASQVSHESGVRNTRKSVMKVILSLSAASSLHLSASLFMSSSLFSLLLYQLSVFFRSDG